MAVRLLSRGKKRDGPSGSMEPARLGPPVSAATLYANYRRPTDRRQSAGRGAVAIAGRCAWFGVSLVVGIRRRVPKPAAAATSICSFYNRRSYLCCRVRRTSREAGQMLSHLAASPVHNAAGLGFGQDVPPECQGRHARALFRVAPTMGLKLTRRAHESFSIYDRSGVRLVQVTLLHGGAEPSLHIDASADLEIRRDDDRPSPSRCGVPLPACRAAAA